MTNSNNDIHSVLQSINLAWREGHPDSMMEHLHPEIAMVFPGFKGVIHGRNALIAGFQEFCTNAQVLEYDETDERIDTIGDCAIATYHFRMLYQRAAYRELSEGRDIWVFHRQHHRWVAVWRTMVDVCEDRSPLTPSTAGKELETRS